MPIDCFDVSLEFVRREEGGYTCSPEDSGNWSSGHVGIGRLIGSKWGVGAPALLSWVGPKFAQHVTAEEMKALSDASYVAIMRARYWRAMGCDGLPRGVALSVCDFGWNAGDATSVVALQTVLGVHPDGDCGPKTQAAAMADPDTSHLLHRLAGAQTAHYRALHNFDEFGRGWLARTGRRLVAALQITSEA